MGALRRCLSYGASIRLQYNHNVSQYLYPFVELERPTNNSSPFAITTSGCKVFCGSEPKRYSRDVILELYLTWILPLLGGLVLQVPFESGGHMVTTMLQLARWLGNPVAILLFTLRNIRATGRACRLYDIFTSSVSTTPRHDDRDERGGRVTGSAPVEPSADTSRDRWHDHCSTNETAASDLRDGLYILGVLNQYDIEPGRRSDDLDGTASLY
jgi:hypothetical protein